jgi:GTP-binding protein Era
MKTGFVAIAGRPNAGKSTLLNRLVGEKLAITSPKAQTTRDRVVGIRTEGDMQIIFLDTPGLLDPEYELHTRMRHTAHRALEDADVIVHLHDAAQGIPDNLAVIAGLDRTPKAPIILALNQVDRITPDARAALALAAPDAVLCSAIDGTGVDALLARIAALLPEMPFLYPDDELSTLPMRFFASELVRETALEQLEEEVPYSIACEIEEFREDRSPVYIRATLYVERDSQKRILIGAKGARIRDLGSAARVKIEKLVGASVYLDLWVKVEPKWRRKAHVLDRLGYRLPGGKGSR